jgi:predicted transcriptional regulator
MGPADPAPANLDGLLKIKSDATLDDVIALTLQQDLPLLVVGEDGKIVGHITRDDALSALKL